MNNQNNNNNPSDRDRAVTLYVADDLGLMSDPRKESFCGFLKSFFCPKLKFMSITTLILFVNVVLYIVEVAQGIEISTLKNPSFLAAKSHIFKPMGSLVNFFFLFSFIYLLIY